MGSPWLFLSGLTIAAAFLMFLANHFALRPWRRSVGSHWTERARLLASARSAQMVGIMGLVMTVGMSWAFLFADEYGSGWVAVAVLGVLVGTYPAKREIEPAYTWTVWVKETGWALAIQFGVFAILIGLAFSMPKVMQAQDWVLIAGGLTLISIIQTGVWLPLYGKFFSKDHAEGERFRRIVAEATAISGVTPRYAWLAETPMANAFALVYIHGITVTTRAVAILSDEELKAVILHEMSHLKEGVVVRLLRLAKVLSWALFIFIRPMMHHFGHNGFWILLAAFWGIHRLAREVERRMENQADAAVVTGLSDPKDYASALEKLYKTNQMPAVVRGSKVHPHLYDRMLTAGITPEYARPEPPARMAWTGWVLLLLPLTSFFLLYMKNRVG